MVTIKSTYLGELRTEEIHIKSGNKIITDAPTDNNGKGEAFSPTDLVCASLCSCMMTIMGIRAQKYDIQLQGLDAEITKVMSASPRKIAKIKIDFRLQKTNASEEQLKMLKDAALTCPVALSLNPDIDQDISFAF
ncbi:OsmC family protein [Catalinimonas niigatensis]|uniref:OsmC family protein n=1 Tax=Catalinimonas niigatensis TaxID=1397264 RepID=UPI0026666695|nr:OsmC family protein [Catalinimonas niigatensis]WPP51543.1 OsmC family protein [Catalinimonas niigatensis]